MSVSSLEPVELVLWKKVIKHSEMDEKNKILLFKPVALYYMSQSVIWQRVS